MKTLVVFSRLIAKSKIFSSTLCTPNGTCYDAVNGKAVRFVLVGIILSLLAACNPYQNYYQLNNRIDRAKFSFYQASLERCEDFKELKLDYGKTGLEQLLNISTTKKTSSECAVLIEDGSNKFLCDFEYFKDINLVSMSDQPYSSIPYRILEGCGSTSLEPNVNGLVTFSFGALKQDMPKFRDAINRSKQCEYNKIYLNYEWLNSNNFEPLIVGIYSVYLEFEEVNNQCVIKSIQEDDDTDQIDEMQTNCDISFLDKMIYDGNGDIRLTPPRLFRVDYSEFCDPLI